MTTPTTATAPGSPAATPAPTVPTVKAKPGELRATVAGILAADPTKDFSVTDLVTTLGNSGGAIGNPVPLAAPALPRVKRNSCSSGSPATTSASAARHTGSLWTWRS